MIEIGRNPDTNEPIYFPTEQQAEHSPHIGIFGGAGFGKSFLLKKEIVDFAAHLDTKTFIIGAEFEYQQLADETNIELLDLYTTHRDLTAEKITEKYSAFPTSRLYIDQDTHVSPQMLYEIIRPARMHGCTVIYAAQSISYGQYSEVADLIYENTGSFILLTYGKTISSEIYKRFNRKFELTESEVSFVSERDHGLLITRSERTPFVIGFLHP